MKDCSHDDAMAKLLCADPAYAAELLAEVHCNGDLAELAILSRQMDKAREGEGGIPIPAADD